MKLFWIALVLVSFLNTNITAQNIDCSSSVVVNVGNSFTASTSGNNNLTFCNLLGSWEGGYNVYEVTTSEPFCVTISDFTNNADFDLFVLYSCQENDCIASSYSTSDYLTDQVSICASDDQTYLIVVASYGSGNGSYNINFLGDSGPDFPPAGYLSLCDLDNQLSQCGVFNGTFTDNPFCFWCPNIGIYSFGPDLFNAPLYEHIYPINSDFGELTAQLSANTGVYMFLMQRHKFNGAISCIGYEPFNLSFQDFDSNFDYFLIIDGDGPLSSFTLTIDQPDCPPSVDCHFICEPQNFVQEVCSGDCFIEDPFTTYAWSIPPATEGNCDNTYTTYTVTPSTNGVYCPGITYTFCHKLYLEDEPTFTDSILNFSLPTLLDECCYTLTVVENTPQLTCASPNPQTEIVCAGECYSYFAATPWSAPTYDGNCDFFVAGPFPAWDPNNCFAPDSYTYCYYLDKFNPTLNKNGALGILPPYYDTCCYTITILESIPSISCPSSVTIAKCASVSCVELLQTNFLPNISPLNCGFTAVTNDWPADNCFPKGTRQICYDLLNNQGQVISNCCFNITITDILINLSFTAVPASCSQNNGSATVTPSGGKTPYTYTWSNGTTNKILSNVTAGIYNVTVTDFNGCIGTGTISVPGSGEVDFSFNNLVASCGLNNGQININISAGTAPFSYEWSGGSGAQIAGTNLSLNNILSGNYSFTITDANGCSEVENTNVEGSSPINDVLFQTEPSACNPKNGKIIINSIVGGTSGFDIVVNDVFHGSTVSGQYLIEDLMPGGYKVEIYDSRGCYFVEPISVDERPRPADLILTPTLAKCDPINSGTIDVKVIGGTGPFDFKLGTMPVVSGTDHVFTGLIAGTYSIFVTDFYGCSISKAISVGLTSGPSSLTITPTQPGCNDGDGKFNIQIDGGTTPYQIYINGAFELSSNLNEIEITELTGGSYLVNITDGNGCKIEKVGILNKKNIPMISIQEIIQPSCQIGNNGTIILGVQEDALYSLDGNTFQSNNSFKDLPPGQYKALIQDINSKCYSEEINLVINPMTANFFANADTVNFDFYSSPVIFDVLSNDFLDGLNNFHVTPLSMQVVNPQFQPIGTIINRSSNASEFEFYYHGNYDLQTKRYQLYFPFENQEVLYELCTDDCPAVCDTGVIYLRNKFECIDNNGDFINTISPNEDGKNDFLIIPNFPECNVDRSDLKIFDRWGTTVFEAINYQNDWSGKNKNGENLPEATYYYIIKFSTINGLDFVIKNFVEIIR